VILAWALAWRHLAQDWGAEEQYRYGFGVPLLAAWIAWRRFPGPVAPAPAGPLWWCVMALALAMLALGTALSWHDPLWRLTGAMLEAGATLLCIAWLHRLGGGPLVRRQLFTLLFAALAVPWPVPVELWTIRHLASAVTDIAVSTANLIGIPALQHGNTVELTSGFVGMDEACSGIQSLQAALMATFFLGEFFALSVARRIAIVAAGAAVSFIANCGRVLALTAFAHTHGGSVPDGWHDFIGGTATAVTFALLLGAALLIARGNTPPPPADAPYAARARMPEGIAVFALVLAIPLAARAWLPRFQDARTFSTAPAWVLSDAHLPPGWSTESVPPTKTLRTGLRFSEWQSFQLRDPGGATAQVIRLAWRSGVRMPAFATNHTPAVCMPSSGWTQHGAAFLLTLKVRGTELPCAAYPFERDGARLLALQNLSAGGLTEMRLTDPAQIPGGFRRLATLWQAPLRQITDELLLYIPDPGDAEERKNSATAFLEVILVRQRQ
jgi:exosortase